MKESYYKPLIINITYRKSANNNLFKSLPLTLSSSKLITNCMPPLKLIPLIINLDSNLIKCYKLTLYYKDKNSHSESWIKAFKFKSKTLNTKKINSNLITNKNINLFKDKSSKEITIIRIPYPKYFIDISWRIIYILNSLFIDEIYSNFFYDMHTPPKLYTAVYYILSHYMNWLCSILLLIYNAWLFISWSDLWSSLLCSLNSKWSI